MSKISVEEINKLRHFTGLGLLDCKKALLEAQGNFEQAVVLLRKKGLKIVAGKQDREAGEGIAYAKNNSSKTSGVIIELSCETDFVAKNDTFIAFAAKLADLALEHQIFNVEAICKIVVDGSSVEEQLSNLSVKVGERVVFKNCHHLSGDIVVYYVHSNYRIAVLLAAKALKITETLSTALRDVAMQVASMNPLALRAEDVDHALIQRELDIAKEQAEKEGKAAAHIERIAEGKLKKFFKENVLLEQTFLKDSSKTVKEYLRPLEGVEVLGYIRAQIK